MQGQNDPQYEEIVKAISSIIFLSTPHRGTNLAEILNRILQVSFLTNPMQFIAELASGSQTLRKLNEQFRHIAPKLQIVSFYETRPTPIVRKAQVVGIRLKASVLLRYLIVLCRWFWRRIHQYLATLERYRSLLMRTTMGSRNTRVPRIIATLLSGTHCKISSRG